MSLNSSLYTGTSGLKNMGNAMQVIGDNVANVNTIGFKRKTYTFSDVLSEVVGTQSGSAQVGRGMALGSIMATFEQGSIESTSSATDMAIGGDGFFIVQQQGAQESYYTRAGNFSFNEDGYLVNPQGYVVQGWALDAETGEESGSLTDIVLSSFTSAPQQTDEVTVITNLDATAESRSSVLSNEWDGTADPPIDSASYEYQTVVQVYDSLGSTHDITIYYDKKADNEWEYVVTCDPGDDSRNLVQETKAQGLLAQGTITFTEDGAVENMTMYELSGTVGNLDGTLKDAAEVTVNENTNITVDGHGFLCTMSATGDWVLDPAILAAYPNAVLVAPINDSDTINISLDAPATTADITINLDRDAETNDTIEFDINVPSDPVNYGLQTQDVVNLACTPFDPLTSTLSKETTTMTINNPAVLTEDSTGFSFTYDAATSSWTPTWPAEYAASATVINSNASKLQLDLDGDSKADITFEFEDEVENGDVITFDVVGTTAWAEVDETNNQGYLEFTADFLGGAAGATEMTIAMNIGATDDGTGQWINDSLASTQYSASSSTTFQDGNGFGAGDLESVSVSTDGVMTGTYSNGQLIPLYRVGLAKFNNNQGLYSMGGNLYSETTDSGPAVTNQPGENGLGSISPNSLEISNVDIADELVKMITTQRGYQANSKTITTVDDMLSEVIAMKR